MGREFNSSISSRCTDLHAVITDAAVGAAWRPIEVTGRAPLHAHLDALHVHVLVERCAELVVLVLVLVCCGGKEEEESRVNIVPPFSHREVLYRRRPLLTHWQHAGIHEGGHGKVGQDEQEEEAAAWRYSGADGRRQPWASECANKEGMLGGRRGLASDEPAGQRRFCRSKIQPKTDTSDC